MSSRLLHCRSEAGCIQRSSHRGERGVSIVEFAFVAMIMFTMLAATVDYGRAWQSGMAVVEATRTGARVGSGQARSANADYNALTGLRAALMASGKLSASNTTDVELVVIYRSTTPNGAVPTSCTTASPSGTCNVFTGAQLMNLTTASFNIIPPAVPGDPPTGTGCANSGAALLRNWCPSARVNSPQGSADYYGVYVRYRQRNLFSFLGSDRTITRTSVMRLEPPSI